MKIVIDFEKCIAERQGTAITGVVMSAEDYIDAFIQEGIEVIIATPIAPVSAVKNWLEDYDIPFTDVVEKRPEADVWIEADDFENWPHTLEIINSKLGLEIEI